jgi:hypothetical protein
MNAWHSNRMEFDKSLLTLSAGGIALSITLLTQFGIASELVLRALEAAVTAFAASALCIFIIYKRNAAYLITTFSAVAEGATGLKRLDFAAASLVALGVVFLSYGGILSAEFKFRKEQNMTKTIQPPVGVVTPDKLHEGSVEQWETFRPAKPQESKPAEQQKKPTETEKPAAEPVKKEKPAGK